MRISSRVAFPIGAAAFVLLTAPVIRFYAHAQNRMTYSIVAPAGGHTALGLALRKLDVSGTFMQAPAHPDDETNALFAFFGYGLGLRTVDVQNNRGDGGQNEIGPELFGDMAVLRTSELLAAHRIDGAEQYFTRAIDFGYSFSPQEVIDKWGRADIVGDYVRLIRTLRPDVVVTMNIQGRGGDRAHEATTILVHEGWLAAGDPARYPEQMREGLRPWQPKKLYFAAGFGGRGGDETPPGVKLTPVDIARYDPLLGRSYAEIGTGARGMHLCQGTGGMPPLPGTGGGRGGRGYQLVETAIPGQKDKNESSLFDGIDTRLTALARFAGPQPPAALTGGLAAIADHAQRAQSAFASSSGGVATLVEEGLAAVRNLRRQLPSMRLSDEARYEIDFRLRTKERDYEDAVLAAHDLSFDAVADDGLVIRGQPVKLTLLAVNRGSSPVTVTGVSIEGFEGPARCTPSEVAGGATYACDSGAHIPTDSKPTTPYFHDDYWKHPANQAIQIFSPGVPFGVPFAPTPFRVTFHLMAGGVEVARDVPVEFRYVKDTYFGEKRMELNVVPEFSVAVTPQLMVIPAPAAAGQPIEREVHVTVTNGVKGPAEVSVALDLPPGWKASPAHVPIAFAHEDESLSARFQVTAPAQVKTGDYTLRAVVTSSVATGQKFADGYQVIEYPHVERRQVIKPAQIALEIVDAKITPDVSVGYIVGVGDQVPPAIEQLGARLSFIGPEELASGDLSKYGVIMTGVRAYERRADLRAYNRRLLDYAERGGTVIVQYNKFEFNQSEYGPYPAKVSSNRVTDETAPVKVLEPGNPVFNYPNKIGPATWAGWVQERGLYFLGEKDKRYVDLVSMVDSFKDNPGVKLGSFVEGRYGKGRWIYLGLGLWRQLPAGTEGAYQLLANLISLGKEPAAAGKNSVAAR
jgi:hypothetical protein